MVQISDIEDGVPKPEAEPVHPVRAALDELMAASAGSSRLIRPAKASLITNFLSFYPGFTHAPEGDGVRVWN